ncbi:MAG: hypothetical protein JXK94_08070 [Deltaproteobacteria bacterium]|nr:hypothetical protein [Deltaproteobacteria bacterium]
MSMSGMLKTGLTVLLLVFFCAGFSFAGDKIQKKDQIRKKDTSCQSYIQKQDVRVDLAKDQTRDRIKDQKKDGSCQS